ncbi:hypothetical protein KCU83_g126, partial [Aureobasidium melanogenum]
MSEIIPGKLRKVCPLKRPALLFEVLQESVAHVVSRKDLVFPDSGPESPAVGRPDHHLRPNTLLRCLQFYHLFGLESSTQIADAYTALVFGPDQAAKLPLGDQAHEGDCEALESEGEAAIVCVCRRRLGWNLQQQREWYHQEIWRRGSLERAGPGLQFPGLE